MLQTDKNCQDVLSLEDFTNAEKVEHVSDNLSIKQDQYEPSVFLVTLRNSRDDDCKKILEGLLKTSGRALDVLTKERGYKNGFHMVVSNAPSFGEIVWPILPLLLFWGGVTGMLVAFAFGCLLEVM